MIGLVDYGMGNRRSVEKALQRVGAEVVQTSDVAVLSRCDGLFVPGVGAFPAAMQALHAVDGLVELLRGCDVPVFGSCLGMQLLFEASEEHGGDVTGLGLLPGAVRRLDARGLKLPHIGWNEVRWRRPGSPLVAGLPDPSSFYHVHTYVPHPAPEHVLGESDYGSVFASVVGDGRVFGAQFHPEKSSAHGLALLENFVKLCTAAVPA